MTKIMSPQNIASALDKFEQTEVVSIAQEPIKADVAALITAANTLASLLRDITDLVITTSGQERPVASEKMPLPMQNRISETAAGPIPEPAPLSSKEIEETLSHEYIVCLEDGRRVKSLKPYLRRFSLTPDQYRRKWKLPADYPMVCRSLSEKRSALVRKTRPHLKRYPHIENEELLTLAD